MGVPKQVQMYVDSREKVTARYQVISRSEQNDCRSHTCSCYARL